MNISQTGIELTVEAETRGSPAPHRTYKDERGRLCCGYGHVLKPGEAIQMPLSRQRSWDLLMRDLRAAEDWVSARVQPIAQHQFDALVCWAYQALPGRVQARGQTVDDAMLLKMVNIGRFQLAAAEFENWVFSDGRVHRPNIVRRQRESWLFMHGDQNA